MKNSTLVLLLFISTLFISCGGDDETNDPVQPGLTGTITFDGVSYAIASGFFSQSTVAAGIEGEFFLADGTITSTGSSSDSQIILGIRAISEGTSTLEAGTYEVNRQVTSKYAFVTVTTANASNVQSILGGTIAISGTDNTYSLTFNNVAFGSGIELTGSVTGTFEN